MYNIKDNRWCARISAPHKSNGVYLVVDVRGGTWCQKCYDPDCRWGQAAGLAGTATMQTCMHAAVACLHIKLTRTDASSSQVGPGWSPTTATRLLGWYLNGRMSACASSYCPMASCC